MRPSSGRRTTKTLSTALMQQGAKAMVARSSPVADEASEIDAAKKCFRHRGPVTCVASIPNTRMVVTSGYDSAVGMFNLDTGVSELLSYHDHLVNRIIVSPDGRLAASSSSDYTICLWDLRARRLERVLRGHSDDVEDFAFVNDGRGVSASRDHRIIIWDLQSGAIIRT